MQVANTILQQLGGNKFLVMTGSKNLVGMENGLKMNLTRNKAKAKWLIVTLNSMDTYDMQFVSMDKSYNTVTKAKFEGVYSDMLQSIFTEATGLYTSL